MKVQLKEDRLYFDVTENWVRIKHSFTGPLSVFMHDLKCQYYNETYKININTE